MSTEKAAAPANVVVHNSEYEIIDLDPYFGRVVGYFRPSDWLKVGLFTASGPAFLAAADWVSSRGARVHVPPRLLRTAGVLGFIGGFFNQYAVSWMRFQGVNENAREVAKDRFEIKSRLARGLPAYRTNESSLPAWIQDVAARNSTYATTNLAVLPWFNLVHHDQHGVNLSRYYETRPGEEKWGFDLKQPDSQ